MSSKKQLEQDKHSRSGMSEELKRGGHGKGNWGVGGLDDLNEDELSPNDPNYVSEEEEKLKQSKEQPPKRQIMSMEDLIQEYFSSGDNEEASKNFQDQNYKTEDKSNFVKKIINIAMEKHAYERELTSQLLSHFYSKLLSIDDISEGFQLVLTKLEDYVLDTPNAVEVVGKFLARAIVDEIVAPAFLKNATTNSALAKEAVALAHGMVTEPHRTGRLEHIWGPGDLSSVKRLKEEVNLLLGEYLTNLDIKEAQESVRRLNAPSFHFQIVKLAIRMGLQKTPTERQKLQQLLSSFAKIGVLSPEAIKRGFQVCYESLSDLVLDVPDAKKLLDEFKYAAQQDGYFSEK
jgi:programmed cell death protein 4